MREKMDKDTNDDEDIKGTSKQVTNREKTPQRAPTRKEHLRSELQSIISRLRAVFKGLPHRRDAIFDFLAEVLRDEPTLRSLGTTTEVLHVVQEIDPIRLDRRITRKPFRQLIELTCTCSVKLKSRHANALAYAKAHRCPPAKLRSFVKREGGIEACARKHVNGRRERER